MTFNDRLKLVSMSTFRVLQNLQPATQNSKVYTTSQNKQE